MEPQLAVGLAWDKIPRYAHYSMEPKLDGIRCVAYKDSNGRVTLTSRGSKDLTEKVPHIVDRLEEKMLPGTYFDGELGYRCSVAETIPIFDFNKTTRVLGSGVETALEKQDMNEGLIQFYVFDYLDHDMWKQWQRRQILMTILSFYIFNDPVVPLFSMDAWDEQWYNAYVQAGGEGVMLKNPDAFYDPGGRHANNWYKVKKFDTIDAQIVAFKEGKGKYERMCGALQVRTANGVEFSVAGMDDTWRQEFWDNDPKYDLKWIEVKHFGLTAGTPRFPQFLRMRPDLD